MRSGAFPPAPTPSSATTAGNGANAPNKANAAPAPSWRGSLARRDPRCKIVALLLLAFAFSLVTRPALLPLLFAIAIGSAWLCDLSARTLLQRLRAPALLIVLLVAALPFVSSGNTVFSLGPLTASDQGFIAAALIAGRFLAIFTLATALLGSTPLLDNLHALRALGVPALMTDMALLVVRYLEVARHDLRQMHVAMRLRGHRLRRLSLSTLRTQAWLIGSLLVRSHERAEGVYLAMRARGYGGFGGYGDYGEPSAQAHRARQSPFAAAEILTLASAGLLTAGLCALEFLARS